MEGESKVAGMWGEKPRVILGIFPNHEGLFCRFSLQEFPAFSFFLMIAKLFDRVEVTALCFLFWF